MIRRISKSNDLKDLIKSCPSGVIDDITSIKYFIQGHPETEIEAEFEKVGTHLEVILPTSALETLSNGILMRRALYKVEDSSYPDGYYNLEFLDDMNVWLGDEETEDPFDPGYLTPDDLKTINYQSIVGSGNINIEASIPDYYATKSWVSEQGYLKSVPSGYATQSWVLSQSYLNSQSLTGYATESWVSSQQFATQSWVSGQGYASATDLSGYATESWVEAQGYITSTGLSGLATISWVESQNYLNSQSLTGYATESWVSSQQFATQSWATSEFLEESKVWTGTQSQWEALTPAQQAGYTIALITE